MESDFSWFESLPAEAMLEVNQHCDRFEDAWRGQNALSLSDWVSKIAKPEGPVLRVLAAELITIDLAHRTSRGLRIQLGDYVNAFPDLEDKYVRTIVERRLSAQETTRSSSESTRTELIAVGDQIGDYLIESKAGAGGMGQVYRARHKLMDRAVAIKLLNQSTVEDEVAQQRFLREIRSLAKLSHHNIVTAFDARVFLGRTCLVTEWVDGDDLRELVRRDGPLSTEKALTCVRQAAEGLQYAHSVGLIHRDVKPANLILTPPGVVKLLDLGLAKLDAHSDFDFHVDDSLTAPHQFVGTAAYISPEQSRGAQSVDHRADVYSLGCTLFYLMTGEPPFRGATTLDTILAHTSEEIPDVNRYPSGAVVPQDVVKLLHQMMAKSPSDRPQSMQEVVEWIGRIRTPSPAPHSPKIERPNIQIKRPSALHRPRGSSTKRRSLLVVAVAFLGIATLAAVLWPENKLPERTAESLKTGIRFDGQESFAKVQPFNVAIGDRALMEVLVTPEDGVFPANVATWAGEEILVLFINTDHRWGVAVLENGESYLELSDVVAQLDVPSLVAVRRDQHRIDLTINGIPAPTARQQYPLVSTQSTLCFGGMPNDLFPMDTGTRFFTGTIHALRLSDGSQPNAESPAEILSVSAKTHVLFRMDELVGSTASDDSDRWSADLFNATWVQPIE
ncbi:MAG: serine/threonine-protein kinase [Planctomycetota bacterium]